MFAHLPHAEDHPDLQRPDVDRRRALRLVVGAPVLAMLASVAEAAPFTRGLLWKISRTGARDSYVFGTIHLSDPRVAFVPAPVLDAMKLTRTFASEVDLDGLVDPRTFELEQMDESRSLAALLTPAVFGALKQALATSGAPDAVLDRMKPWAAMLAVVRAQPASSEVIAATAVTAMEPLDRRLVNAARGLKMKSMALEWIDEQIAAFDSIPLRSQVALLEHVLAHPDYLHRFTEPTIRAWLARDLAGIARVSDAISVAYPAIAVAHRDLQRAIIVDRTVLMHHRLALPLASGAVFVGVGAMHLHGARGLLAAVVADGYRVERVW